MIDAAEFLWSFSLISLLLRFVHAIRKKGFFSMVLSTGPRPSVSPSSSSSSSPSSPWTVYRSSRVFTSKGMILASLSPSQESSGSYSREITHPGRVLACGERSPPAQKPRLCTRRPDFGSGGLNIEANRCPTGTVCMQDRLRSTPQDPVPQCPREESMASIRGVVIGDVAVAEAKVCTRTRKRPARIVVPEACVTFDEACKDLGERELQVEGKDFCVASRRGRRKVMEDAYGVMTNIDGNSKKAFFGVFDGHGGREAVDYVADKLGKNILRALGEMSEEEEDQLEKATKVGYQTTDQDFAVQGIRSGACAATVLIKDGEAQVANAGDCRVVLSRKGVAEALTRDHRLDRQDERSRIESSRGYVNIHNGVWRVQGSLAVSRAIGDSHLKQWVISEPDTQIVRLTPECQFFIIASDGLWDKVSNQEAVDVVLKHKNSIESCKLLVELSCMRGNLDDITVMVVDLLNFLHK